MKEEKSCSTLSVVLKVLAVLCAVAGAVAVALIIVKKVCKKKACNCAEEEEVTIDDCCYDCDCDCSEVEACVCCDEIDCPVEDAISADSAEVETDAE